MSQTIIVFIFYCLLFCWLITMIPFIKKTTISKHWLISLFLIKVTAGLAYAFFYLQPAYYATSDTWHYFELSKGETAWLLSDPLAFLKDIFVHGYRETGNLFLGENSYWNDLKSNVIIKLIAVCNVFTFTNYFANIVLFNFFFFFGPVALYRLSQSLFSVKPLLLTAAIFLIPSFLFWCSGIHKDGLIFLGISIILFHFHKQLSASKVFISSVLISAVFLALLFVLRNFMAILLLPALVAWALHHYFPAKSLWLIGGMYSICIIIFFISGTISPAADLPGYVIEKQNEFKQLPGASVIEVPALDNDITSFLRFFPTAIDIAFFRPHITEIKNISYIPSVAELVLIWLVCIAAVFMKGSSYPSVPAKAFFICCFCLALSFLLLAGYTITFSGAIVRYRAVILPFLAIPLLQTIDQLSLPKPLKKRKKGNV